MLFGEHAVLQGKLALACAVTRRLRVELVPRGDAHVFVHSDLGRYESPLHELAPDPRFRFVLAAIGRHAAELPGGFDLRIASDFPPDLGLGSSAAVTVATLAALGAWLAADPDREALCRAARTVIREVQGPGSGADAAASVFGGIVAYHMEPMRIRRLPAHSPLTVVYAGRKTPTADVVARVEAARARFPELYAGLFDLVDRVALGAQEALLSGDWDRVGELMNVGHGLMEALGLCDADLAAIVHALRAAPGVRGAKISGSGLGDCAVALGEAEAWDLPYLRVPVQIEPDGLQVGEA